MLYSTLEIDGTAFRDISFLTCGKQECTPAYAFGPETRDYYLIHFCLSGHGMYFAGGETHEIGQGDGFLIFPEELTYYQADKDDPWTYLWVNFRGDAAKDYLARCGLDQKHLTFHCGYGDQLLACVDKMLTYTNAGNDSEFFLQGQLYLFLGWLAKSAALPCPRGLVTGNAHVNRAVNYIRAHFQENITVQKMADHVNLNRSYLCTLFQDIMHISPQKFLTKFRMTRASEMLLHTDLPIAQIARACGYVDPLTFSKAFKQEIGTAPSVYRETQKTDYIGTLTRSADPHAEDKRGQ